MGFFSDLKDDLSQAVNELMPEEGAEEAEARKMRKQKRERQLLLVQMQP